MHRTVVQAREYGIDAQEPVIDFSVAQERKRAVVERLFAGITHLVGSKAITLLEGTGRLAGDHAVEISFNDNSKQVVTGEIIVVAAGSMPRTLPGFDVDGHTVLTSEELLELDSLPASVAIIGGGAIGCEFASMLSDLGTRVLSTTETLAPELMQT